MSSKRYPEEFKIEAVKQGTEEKHYTVRPIDLLRKWHTEYENWMLSEADITQ